jgi:hypothetical protein
MSAWQFDDRNGLWCLSILLGWLKESLIGGMAAELQHAIMQDWAHLTSGYMSTGIDFVSLQDAERARRFN